MPCHDLDAISSLVCNFFHSVFWITGEGHGKRNPSARRDFLHPMEVFASRREQREPPCSGLDNSAQRLVASPRIRVQKVKLSSAKLVSKR